MMRWVAAENSPRMSPRKTSASARSATALQLPMAASRERFRLRVGGGDGAGTANGAPDPVHQGFAARREGGPQREERSHRRIDISLPQLPMNSRLASPSRRRTRPGHFNELTKSV